MLRVINRIVSLHTETAPKRGRIRRDNPKTKAAGEHHRQRMHLEKYGLGNLVLASLGFLLNNIMLVTLLKQKSKKAPQVFLINLCIADILIGVFAFISGISVHISESAMNTDERNELFQAFSIGILFSFNASLPTCWTITFDRLFAIQRPLRHASYYTAKKLKLHILMIWLYATITTTITITGGILMSTMIVIRYVLAPSLFVTLVLLAIAYTLIIKAILKNNRKMAGIVHVQKSAANNSRARMNKRIYIHSLIIILNFTLCSSPYVIFSIFHSPLDHNEQPLFMAIGTMGLTAIPVIDSVSYFFLNLLIRTRSNNKNSMVMKNITVK